MAKKRLSDEKVNRIIDLHKQGYNGAKISEIVGVSKASVYRRIAEYDMFCKGTKDKKELIDKNGPVHTYTPDYRREITPATIETLYEYGGITFTANYNDRTIELQNIHDKIETLYDEHNIEDLKCLGESLVGIAMSFNKLTKITRIPTPYRI